MEILFFTEFGGKIIYFKSKCQKYLSKSYKNLDKFCHF